MPFVTCSLSADAVGASGARIVRRRALVLLARARSSFTIETSQGTASLRLLVAALSGCPLRMPIGNTIGLRPCVELQIGSVEATGAGPTLVGETVARRPWAATGAFARLEWRAARSLFIDAQGGATFALLQDRFYFTPATTIAELPVVAGAFKVGARFAWP